MSDEFLYRLREMPRPEFAEALKARVFQERPRSPTARRVRTGLVVLLAALIVAACAAPPIRKPLMQATVQATAEIFGPFMRTSRPIQVEAFSCTEDFQKSLSFPVHLPTWIPEGLQCGNVNYIRNPWGGMVMIEWRAPDGSSSFLLTVHDTPKVTYMADEKEPVVLLNGKSATLLRKRGEENAPAMLMIQWVDEENGTTYCLRGLEGQISQDVLLKIAASVR